MRDECFAGLLDDMARILRPEVSLTGRGSPRSAVYRQVEGEVACAMQPVAGTLRETVIGRLERATHVAYMKPRDVRAGDVLAECLAQGSLAEGAGQGDGVIMVGEGMEVSRGDRLVVGEGEEAELVVAVTVSGAEIGLMAPLSRGHEGDDAVTKVRGYEVVGVRDEAGVGHHLRVSLRELTA